MPDPSSLIEPVEVVRKRFERSLIRGDALFIAVVAELGIDCLICCDLVDSERQGRLSSAHTTQRFEEAEYPRPYRPIGLHSS